MAERSGQTSDEWLATLRAALRGGTVALVTGTGEPRGDPHARTLAALRQITGRMPRDVQAWLVALDHGVDWGCSAHSEGQMCCLDTVTAAAAEALRTEPAEDISASPAVARIVAETLDEVRAERDLMHADLGDLLRAVGMFDGAQPASSHEVMQEAIAAVRQLAAAAGMMPCQRCGQRTALIGRAFCPACGR